MKLPRINRSKRTVEDFLKWIGPRVFTAGDIATHTGLPSDTIRGALIHLSSRGRITAVKGSKRKEASIWRVTE